MRPFIYKTFAGLAVLLTIPAPSFAQASSPQTNLSQVSLSELDARLRAYPQLDAYNLRADAERERGSAATALPDPEITMGLNNFPLFDPSFTEYLPTNKSIGLRQRFPNGDRRDAVRDEAFARASRLDAARAARLAELRADLRVQLVTLQRVEEQIVLLDGRLAKYAELDEIVLAEVDAGQPSLFRLAEIESERAEVGRRRVALRAEQRQAEARLRELVGTVPDGIVIDPALREWNAQGSEFHAVRVAQETIDIFSSRIDAARADYKPDWGVQATYQQRENGRNFDGDDWVSIGVTVSVPLWRKQKLDPRLRAAQSDRSAAMADVQTAARAALSRYEVLDAERMAARDAVQVIETKIVAVEQALADRLVVYESGLGGYAPILDGEIAVLALRGDIVVERAREDVAIIRMNGLQVGGFDGGEVQP